MAITDRAELESWLRLALIAEVGDATLRKLLRELGTPEQVLAASRSALRTCVSGEVVAHIERGAPAALVARTLRWAEEPANQIVTLADADYPRLLLQISDPPALLYLKGRRELLTRPALAIVGSRNGTRQGLANAQDFARALSDAGLTIVSGLALGIDAAAHRGGLEGAASSIAVVGTGLDVVYPARNRELAHDLAERGLLISEFALGTPPLAGNFPRRNRLISGMSRGCVVIEAALDSGSLITARLANEQGREVFAVPGSIHSPLAKGCHRLIKQGAKLVESAQDILEELRLEAPAAGRHEEAVAAPTAESARVLDQLGFDATTLDALCERCAMPPSTLSALLLELELLGLIEVLPGAKYQRVR